MAELDTNTALLIAAIGASSAIIGGLISSGTSYLIERQKSKNEMVRFQLDKEAQEIELRNEAYKDFLSITEHDVTEMDENLNEFFSSRLVEEEVARILTHGSPKVTNLLVDAYPFKSWKELEKVKRDIMRELVIEKGETWKVKQNGSIAVKTGMDGDLSVIKQSK